MDSTAIKLVLRKIQAVAEGDIAGRIVTIFHRQFAGEPLFQIWQDLESHQPADGRRHQFRDDERDQHAHVGGEDALISA